jgi:hypothetical protein
MKKIFLLLLVLSLLCLYALLKFHIPEIPQKGQLSAADCSRFINFSGRFFLLIAAGLFATLVLSPTKGGIEVKRFSSQVWLNGTLSILGTVIVSALIFNPIGTFPWNTNNITSLNYRFEKPYLYNQLNSVPDMIFLGTSISLRVPAQKYAQKFSLTGFNFSVLGATSIDYFTLTNLIVSKSTPDKKPAVIVTEVLSPSLSPLHVGIPYYQQYPINYVEYMPLMPAVETISTHFDRNFSLSSFFSIIFVEYFTWTKRWTRPFSIFRPDGSTLAGSNTINYKNNLATVSKKLNILLQCDELNSQGKDAISRMVALGKQQHISMVFYRSPINDDFYKVIKKKPRVYEPCKKKFNQFMQQTQIENPNVFYVELSHYAPISSGGQALYKDSHHLNSVGTERILKVLTPTIQKAIEYSRSR